MRKVKIESLSVSDHLDAYEEQINGCRSSRIQEKGMETIKKYVLLTENRNIVTVVYTTGNKTLDAVFSKTRGRNRKTLGNVVIYGEY